MLDRTPRDFWGLLMSKWSMLVSNLFSFKKRGVSTINLGFFYFSKRGKSINKVGSIFLTKYSLSIYHPKTFPKSGDSTDFKPKKYWCTPKLWSSEIFKISPFTLNFFSMGNTLSMYYYLFYIRGDIIQYKILKRTFKNYFGLKRIFLDFWWL